MQSRLLVAVTRNTTRSRLFGVAKEWWLSFLAAFYVRYARRRLGLVLVLECIELGLTIKTSPLQLMRIIMHTIEHVKTISKKTYTNRCVVKKKERSV